LEGGALFVQPGIGKAEVHFAQQPKIIASVEGSRMIVELTGNDIIVYCFEGKCRIDPGAGKDELKIEVGNKRLYHTVLAKADDPVVMTYDEMWAWNLKCDYCLKGIVATPTPTFTPGSDGGGIPPTQPNKDKQPQPTSVPPTQKPPTQKPPTQVPPTQKPPTQVPPTQVPQPTPCRGRNCHSKTPDPNCTPSWGHPCRAPGLSINEHPTQQPASSQNLLKPPSNPLVEMLLAFFRFWPVG